MTQKSSDVSRNLAEKVAALRKSRGMAQEQLAKTSGIPRSTLTHLESGHGNPSLRNLMKIASALHVTIEELLTASRPQCKLVKAEAINFTRRSQGACLVFKLLPDPISGMQIERLEFETGSFMRGIPHSLGTREYFTCIQGEVTVAVEGESYKVMKNDVLAFPGDTRHSYQNSGSGKAVGISVVVLVPSNFE